MVLGRSGPKVRPHQKHRLPSRAVRSAVLRHSLLAPSLETSLTRPGNLVYGVVMSNYAEATKDIAASARICWTCGGTPNPANFGGLCDPCDEARKARLHASARVLADHGQSDTELGQALNFLGYGKS